MESGSIIPSERIERSILLIRGQKVMLDADLADLYDVPTKALNQAVKRNEGRFPEDFAFRLTEPEKVEVVTNCDHLAKLRFSPALPYAFTEQGVAMLSSVLHSERAVRVNISIMRAFVRLRYILASNADLACRLDELEAKYDGQFAAVFEAIKALMESPEESPKGRIGFRL